MHRIMPTHLALPYLCIFFSDGTLTLLFLSFCWISDYVPYMLLGFCKHFMGYTLFSLGICVVLFIYADYSALAFGMYL